jgi:hypothetical protein
LTLEKRIRKGLGQRVTFLLMLVRQWIDLAFGAVAPKGIITGQTFEVSRIGHGYEEGRRGHRPHPIKT